MTPGALLAWTPRSWTDAHWGIVSAAPAGVELRRDRLAWPLLAQTGRRILVGADGDLFDESVPLDFVATVFGVMALCPQHAFQVLTRHPQRLQMFLDWLDRQCGWMPFHWSHVSLCVAALKKAGIDIPASAPLRPPVWPLPNVWLGLRTRAVDVRCGIERLLLAPAGLRWLLLEQSADAVDLTRVKVRGDALRSAGAMPLGQAGAEQSLNALTGCIRHGGAMVTTVGRLDWVVVDARDSLEVARSLTAQCRSAKVPIYCFGGRREALAREVPRRGSCPPTERRSAAQRCAAPQMLAPALR